MNVNTIDGQVHFHNILLKMSIKISKIPLKRKSISIDTKIKILNRSHNGEGSTLLARIFGMNESTIRTIIKNEEMIRKSVTLGSNAKCSSYKRSDKLEIMEKALIIWIEDLIQKGITIDRKTITTKAIKIFNQIKTQNLFTYNGNKKDEFFGSKGWFENFKKRYSLNNIFVNGKIGTVDEKAAEDFLPKFKKIIKKKSYAPDQIFSVSENRVFWKKIINTTSLVKFEEIESGFKTENDRVVMLFCSNASGDRIMKPLIVKTNDIKINNPSVHCIFHKKGKITTSIFTAWFNNYFAPEAKEYMLEKNREFKILLIIDNLQDYPHDLYHPNVEILFLPHNTVSLLQPIQQGIIFNFKINYFRELLRHVIKELNENGLLTLSEVLKRFSILDFVKLTAISVGKITQSILNSSWKAILPEVVCNNKILATNEKIIEDILHLAHSIREDGFEDMSKDDIEEFLVEPEINEKDLIDMATYPTTTSKCESVNYIINDPISRNKIIIGENSERNKKKMELSKFQNEELIVDAEMHEKDPLGLEIVIKTETERCFEYEAQSATAQDDPILFNAINIGEALELAKDLENKILTIDKLNVQRALKFQSELRSCCAEYLQIYNDLTKKKKTKNNFYSLRQKDNFL